MSEIIRQRERWSNIRWFALCLVLATGLWISYLNQGPDHLTEPAALDCAQIAQRVAAGHGLRTWLIPPLTLLFSKEVAQAPALHQPPLWPLGLAVWTRMVGASDRAVRVASGVCWLAVVAVLLIGGFGLFGRRCTLLGVLLFVLNPRLLAYASDGTPAMAAILWCTLALALSLWPSPPHGWRSLSVGLALAAGFLTDARLAPTLAAVALIFLLQVPAGERLRHGGLAGVVALLVIAPWCRWNWSWTGKPVPLWREIGLSDWSGVPRYRYLSPVVSDPWALPLQERWRLLGGGGQWLRLVGEQLPLLCAILVWSLFILRWLEDPEREEDYGGWVAVAGNLLLAWLVWCGWREGGYRQVAMLPMASLWAGAWLSGYGSLRVRRLISDPRSPLAGVARGSVAAAALLSWFTLRLWAEPTSAPSTSPPSETEVVQLQRSCPPHACIASDQPWLVARYVQRPALWLPCHRSQIQALGQKVPLVAIYLTPTAVKAIETLAGGPPPPWALALLSPPGYQFRTFLKEGALYERSTGAAAPTPTKPPVARPTDQGR